MVFGFGVVHVNDEIVRSSAACALRFYGPRRDGERFKASYEYGLNGWDVVAGVLLAHKVDAHDAEELARSARLTRTQILHTGSARGRAVLVRTDFRLFFNHSYAGTRA